MNAFEEALWKANWLHFSEIKNHVFTQSDASKISLLIFLSFWNISTSLRLVVTRVMEEVALYLNALQLFKLLPWFNHHSPMSQFLATKAFQGRIITNNGNRDARVNFYLEDSDDFESYLGAADRRSWLLTNLGQ